MKIIHSELANCCLNPVPAGRTWPKALVIIISIMIWTAVKFNHHSRIMNGSTHGTHTSSAGSLIIVKTQKIMAGIQTLWKPLLMALFYYINYSTSQHCGKGTRDDKPLTQGRNSFLQSFYKNIYRVQTKKTLLQCMVFFKSSIQFLIRQQERVFGATACIIP